MVEKLLRKSMLSVVAGGLMLLSAPVEAVTTLSFQNISANNVGDAAIGEAQLFVDISDTAGGMDLTATQALFTFRNIGPDDSSITQIYFEDGTLLGIAGLIDADDDALGSFGDAGVDYSIGASPPNLPAGNNANPAFQVTAGFLADPDPPTQPNGVNPGESLGIVFDLINGQTLGDTIAALDNPVGQGSLRIGIHVQGFDSGGSESFVNGPGGPGGPGGPTPGATVPPLGAPEPVTAVMSIMALGALSTTLRRRK